MKSLTEGQVRDLLERAFRMGWRRAMEPIDNVPTALIGWNAEPDEFVGEIEDLMKEI